MTTLTLETQNASMTFEIVCVEKFGFQVKLPNGKKVYSAIRNRYNPNFVSVLNGKGRHVFQGTIA